MLSASSWVLQIGHACLWGSLTIAVAYAVCRVLPRLPAGVRAWLWWLACAKLLLGLWIAAPISLPILPAPPAPVLTASIPAAAVPKTAVRTQAWTGTSPASTPALPAAAVLPAAAPPAPRWPLVLLAAWLAGVAAMLALTIRQSVRLAQLRRGTAAVATAIDLKALAAQMGLRGVPRLVAGPNILTPCVAGWLRPAVLLPPGLTEILTAAEMRLTLAHEMAHIKRGDLVLVIVPMLARTLFFFNPLVWWAAAEWAAAREEACDALALSAANGSRAEFGRLLLKLAAPEASAPALGLSPGYHHLRRRLVSLTSARTAPRWAGLFALPLPLLLPWHLTSTLPPAPEFRSTPPVRYSVTALAGGLDSSVFGLNNQGQAALSADAQGYVGSQTTLAALSALPKHHASFAYAINNSGQAAGASFNILGHARAFVWDGATHKIGSLPGYPYSEARGISDTGEIAGFSESGRPDRLHAWVSRAFVRPSGGPLTDLGTLGGPYSAAYAISGSGIVAGKADTEDGPTHAFSWTESSGMTDLGTLGGANSAAYAVNGSGAIAGMSETDGAGTRHAFLFENGQMRDLVPLPAMDSSIAYAVSSGGLVAGTSQTLGTKRATLWQNGSPTDLNTLLPPRSGWVLTEARAVNDHGQIAGQGLLNGKPCAFLLTPR